MSKKPPSNQHRNVQTQLSPKSLRRRPIHEKLKNNEIEDHEEIDQDLPNEGIYPDLSNDVREIRQQNKSADIKKKKKKIDEPKQSVKSEKPDDNSSGSWNLKYVISTLLAIITFLVLSLSYFFNQKKTAGEVDLTVLIADMTNNFKEQGDLTFGILKSALKRVVKENSNPSAPAIVTVITNKGAENTASDFSIYLARALAPEQYVSINESVLHRNPDNLKFEIDTHIKSGFDNRSLNVVIVDRLHNIPIDAAMIFHNYCDHENAPFKRAVFLFILHLRTRMPKNSVPKDLDQVAMNALRDIWHDASDDRVDSLITRITVNVVNIR